MVIGRRPRGGPGVDSVRHIAIHSSFVFPYLISAYAMAKDDNLTLHLPAAPGLSRMSRSRELVIDFETFRGFHTIAAEVEERLRARGVFAKPMKRLDMQGDT